MRDVMRNQRDQADRAFTVFTAPSRSTTRAEGHAENAALAQHFQRDEFALCRASHAQSAGDEDFACRRPSCRLAPRVLRRSPARDRRRARARGARSEHFPTDPAAMRFPLGIGIDPQQDAGADAQAGRLFSRFQAGACELECAAARPASVQSMGRAISSPSRSCSTMSATTVAGRGALASENLAAARDGAVGLRGL